MIARARPLSWGPPPVPVIEFDPIKLALVRGVQHGILMVGDEVAFTWGSPDMFLTSWASCSRSWVNALWGVWVTRMGGMALLESLVMDLPCEDADLFDADVKFKHLLSYTSGAVPPGSKWQYSGGGDPRGKHWPRQNAMLGQLFGRSVDEVCQDELLFKVGGALQARTVPDGTLRVYGTCRGQTALARLILNRGAWNGERLIDPAYCDRSIAGGPDGDGRPFMFEGYQTHLCRNGQAWELPSLPGVPDLFMARDGNADEDHGHGIIAGVPSMDVVFVYRGASPALVLPAVFGAVR